MSFPIDETVFAYRERRRQTQTIEASSIKNQSNKIKKWAISCLLHFSSIIEPLSSFKQRWERFIAFLVLFNSMVIPWQMAFRLHQQCDQSAVDSSDACISSLEQWMIVLLDVLFWIDMVMAFRSGFIEKPMTIRMESIHIVKRYLSCFFWIDLIANFPYLAIADGMAKRHATDPISMNLYLLPKLLRVARVFREGVGSHFAPSLSRILKLTAIFIMACHWCACIWYFIGRWEAESFGANVYTGGVSWIEVPLGDAQATYLTSDLTTKYTAAVYWAITTMSTVVTIVSFEGRRQWHRMFTMAVMFLGAISTAILLGNVAVLIANLSSSSQKFRDRRYELDAFLKARAHSWNLHGGMDHEEILKGIPQTLKSNILLHIHTDAIGKTDAFKDCNRSFIRALVTELKAESFASGEVIVHEGDVVDQLYFLKSGKVQVLHVSNSTVHGLVQSGELFGETELLTSRRRSATYQVPPKASVLNPLWKRLGFDDGRDVRQRFYSRCVHHDAIYEPHRDESFSSKPSWKLDASGVALKPRFSEIEEVTTKQKRSASLEPIPDIADQIETLQKNISAIEKAI